MEQAFACNDAARFIRMTLNNTLSDLMHHLNAQCGSLFLYDRAHEELVLETFLNSKNIHLQGLKTRIGEGIAGKVATAAKPVLVRNLNEDARFSKNGFSHYRSNSFISVPLTSSQGLVGLINLTDKNERDPFDEKDLKYVLSVTKYACMSIDIFAECIKAHEQKDALREQKNALEKYATVGKLAAGVVHEINNPLDGVMRYTNILLKHLEDAPLAREYLSEVQSGLSRIARITKSLLEFSHAVNSTNGHPPGYVDIHEVLDEAVAEISLADKQDLRVEKRYATGIPRVMDYGLQHVCMNLVRNAFDAMPDGGTLRITTSRGDGFLRIDVKDTGVGMTEMVRKRIFEPFFTTKAKGKGTGLGLAISREIVNKYEGDIDLLTREGEGTTFSVVIPAKHLKHE